MLWGSLSACIPSHPFGLFSQRLWVKRVDLSIPELSAHQIPTELDLLEEVTLNQKVSDVELWDFFLCDVGLKNKFMGSAQHR